MALSLLKRMVLGVRLTWAQMDSNWTAIESEVNGKANLSHTHAISDVSGLQTALDSKIPLAQKGVPNGVATLDSGGKVPLAQLPNVNSGVITNPTNPVNGVISVPANTAVFSPTSLTNLGTIQLASASTLNIAGRLQNAGLVQSAGLIRIGG